VQTALCARSYFAFAGWLVLITGDSIARAEDESTDLTALEHQVYELVNSHRTAIGLAALAYSERSLPAPVNTVAIWRWLCRAWPRGGGNAPPIAVPGQ